MRWYNVMELAYTNTAKGLNKPRAKVISITSGKGGVGKTSTTTNLALSLSSLGKKVCIFDADTSLANINILLGIRPEFTLEHLLTGEKRLKDIIIEGPRGIKVIPSASGIAEYAHLSQQQKEILITTLDQLQQQFDYIIIDTAAGIGEDVLDFIRASQYTVVVITPEPTSLTDAFSLLKVLKRSGYNKVPYVLVNMALDNTNSQTIFNRFKSAIKKYIDIQIEYLGYIQVDETIISSVSLQCPAVLLKPDSAASRCFKNIANTLDNAVKADAVVSFSRFWQEQNTQRPHQNVRHLSPSQAPPIEAKVALDFDTAVKFCIDDINQNKLEVEQLEPLFNALEKNYHSLLPKVEVSKPSSVRDFYNFLEQQNFPKDVLKDVAHTLDDIYFEQYGENLASFESSVIRFFAKNNHSEDDLQFLNEKLETCYKKHFNKPLLNIDNAIKEHVVASSFSQQHFDALLKNLSSEYTARFSESYKTKADEALEIAQKEIDLLTAEKSALREKLDALKQSNTEKSQLLTQIQTLLSTEKE